METHHEEYLKSERVGVDFFREANIHDSGFISVEQHATFFPYYESTDSQGWSGILLMDLGRINAAPPWLEVAPNVHFHPNSISGHSSLTWDHGRLAEHSTKDPRLLQREPFVSRLSTDQTMSPEEREMCSKDWFIFAADLLDSSALSWAKFLSFMRASHETMSGDPEYLTGRLLADKKVLDRASQYFEEILCFIIKRNCDAPREPDNSDSMVAAQFADRLLNDFRFLQEEALGLTKLCSESVEIAMSNIRIADSRRILAQAERTQTTIYRAFLFLPLILISLIFRMNVQ